MLQRCVCRSKSSFRDDSNLHVSISVLGEAMVWQARLFLGCTNGKVHLPADCEITITNGAWSQWKLDVPLIIVIWLVRHEWCSVRTKPTNHLLDLSHTWGQNCEQVASSWINILKHCYRNTKTNSRCSAVTEVPNMEGFIFICKRKLYVAVERTGVNIYTFSCKSSNCYLWTMYSKWMWF